MRLIKSEPSPAMSRRITRMLIDMRELQTLTVAEIQSSYDELETVRDAISGLLDKADKKNV